jgi:hypothetical protein
MRHARFLFLLAAFQALLIAQAWLPSQGEGTVSLLYQNSIDRLHVFSNGLTKDRGHTYFDAVVLSSDFAATSRIAISFSLPYLDGKYVGSYPHELVRGQPDTVVPVDNGHFHGGFQDFIFTVRYALTPNHSWQITPFSQVTVPSHAYPSFGHAAIGLDEHEYRAGVNAGRRLDPFLPRAFVQGQYAFGASPEVAANVAPKRSYGELQFGYLVSRRFTVQASSVLLYSHNGIDFDYNLFPNNLSDEQYLNHDRIARSRLLDAAGSIAHQANASTNVYVSLGRSLWGINGHLRYLVTTVGFTKVFSTRKAREGESAALRECVKATTCTCSRR